MRDRAGAMVARPPSFSPSLTRRLESVVARGVGAMIASSFFLSVGVGVVLTQGSSVPVPELAFVLQIAGVGAAIGSAIALCARGRDAEADTWRITTAWATLGLVVGVALSVALAI